MRLNQRVIIFLCVFISVPTWASAGDGVPWGFVLTQVINFSITCGLLVFLLRKPIQTFLSERKSMYFLKKQKAEQVRLEAEQKQKNIQDRLTKLEVNAQDKINQAKLSSEQEKQQLIQQAKVQVKKIKSDADHFISVEKTKAVAALTQEFFDDSLSAAQENLETETDSAALQKLNTEFSSKIQAVT